MTTLISQREQTARKTHRCSACGGDIAVGERYGIDLYVDGRDFYMWKIHLVCAALFRAFYDGYDDVGEGALRDVLADVTLQEVVQFCERYEQYRAAALALWHDVNGDAVEEDGNDSQ